MKATCAGVVAASQIPAASAGPRGGSEQQSSGQALLIASLLDSPFSSPKSFSFLVPRKALLGSPSIPPHEGALFPGRCSYRWITEKVRWSHSAFRVSKFLLKESKVPS